MRASAQVICYDFASSSSDGRQSLSAVGAFTGSPVDDFGHLVSSLPTVDLGLRRQAGLHVRSRRPPDANGACRGCSSTKRKARVQTSWKTSNVSRLLHRLKRMISLEMGMNWDA